MTSRFGAALKTQRHGLLQALVGQVCDLQVLPSLVDATAYPDLPSFATKLSVCIHRACTLKLFVV